MASSSLMCSMKILRNIPRYLSPINNAWMHTSIFRATGTKVASAVQVEDVQPVIIHQALPNGPHASKIVFSDKLVCDFKYIWLRDNCQCSVCMHADTKQKLLNTPDLDINILPKAKSINEKGQLEIVWEDDNHRSIYDSKWLRKNGRCFITDTFDTSIDTSHRSTIDLWDRVSIWKNFPEISYKEICNTQTGLESWLAMIHKFGIAIIRDVPRNEDEIVKLVDRFAYIKETGYGITFDVNSEPEPAHLANTSVRLAYHTDLNYREKSPGLQLLHCLKFSYHTSSNSDIGGQSMFVDGFNAASWLKEVHPAAFHMLATTPVRFTILVNGKRYSQHWPVICVDNNNNVQEIHYNNRTMGPLQLPNHMVLPYYHAYKIFSEKIQDPSLELKFHLVPGDLIAFNNRRTLHGRTAFDTSKMSRHLKGCYVDIDEAMSYYDSTLDNDIDHI